MYQEQEAICRVCRGESLVNHVLFHPCKCSGSIRFVHQDCLLQWLLHSKKKYCELCEHPFVFTPIYRQDMPARIPIKVLVQQCILRLAKGCVTSIRALLVMIVWFIILPTVTVWSWRFYFWSGGGFSVSSKRLYHALGYNRRAFLSDCIQGIIITAIVVIVFVAAYLFREWVIQNTTTSPAAQEQQRQPQVPSTIIQDQRDQIHTRLEQLRQELNARRNNNNVNINIPYHNPYSARVAGYHTIRQEDSHTYNSDEDEDDIMHLPSGTQSPFASWRDYQQQDISQLRHHITEEDQDEQPAIAGTWRASEFNAHHNQDYFSEAAAAALVEDNDEQAHMQPTPSTAAVVAQQEEPFDFVENMDGILEAIGMRGNLMTLLKNAMLMSLMINLCLCFTVWIPYVIGRFLILVRPNYLLCVLYFLLNKMQSIYQYVLPDFNTIHVQSSVYYAMKKIRITSLYDNGAQLLTETLDHHIWVTSHIYSISTILFRKWRQCATEHENFVCTAIGYIILISLGYLSRNRHTNEILRQQGVFLKVLFFMFLELVIFPTLCGILLDVSTLPLFTDITIKSRFHFVLLHPWSGVFLHWFVGTGFIFQFSVFVALVREVVRPGVLFFIRDPNDPHFHPVQDIVDQPMLVLLRNLGAHAAAYFMLIVVGMGLVTLVVSKYGGIYPIIWRFDIPFAASLPVDLLAVQFLLPPLMGYIVPREFSKKSVITWWHIVSHHLRLSSYMFGGRYPNEEGNFNTSLERDDGGLVRVPTHDNVPIVVPRRRMLVPVHPVTLKPLDPTEKLMGHPAGNDVNTAIVYIPPFFYLRLSVFLLLIWTTGSLLVCSISVVPLKLGRNLIAKLNLGEDRPPVHDLYSFALGAYIMIIMSSLLNTIVQKYHVVVKDQGHIDWRIVKDYVWKKARKAVKFVYLLIICGFVIPLFVGVTMDLYVFMPLRLSNINDIKMLDIYVTLDWALGLAGLSIFFGSIQLVPVNNTLRETVSQFNWENLGNFNLAETSKRIILPTILGLTMIILLPSLWTILAIRLFDIEDPSIKLLIFRCAYPILFCGICLVILCAIGIRFLKIWLQSIRDDTYLIGKQLHNLEDAAL